MALHELAISDVIKKLSALASLMLSTLARMLFILIDSNSFEKDMLQFVASKTMQPYKIQLYKNWIYF